MKNDSEVKISRLLWGGDFKWNVSEDILTKLGNAYGLKLAQIKDLVAYYESLNVDEDRKFRRTLMKTLEMIEGNDKLIEGIV